MSKAHDVQDKSTELHNNPDTESILEKLIEEFFRNQWDLNNPQ